MSQQAARDPLVTDKPGTTNAPPVLVVEDDPAMRDTCTRILARAGYPVEAVADGETALARLRADPGFRIALVDLKLPKVDGITVLRQVQELGRDLKVIIMTGHGTIKSAVQTMQLGAVDYLVKPFEKDELLAVIAQQVRVGELEMKVVRLESELRGRYGFENIVGQSPQMEEVFEQISAARNNKANVLIVGASGTGKELIARAIHYAGRTAEGPFVPVNCAALPETLIESELFGHTKGSFTGATRDSKGLFRAADGGTIFLDEVFEVPSEVQVKLLRAIQESTVRPVGGLAEVPINARIIAATNQDPSDALERGRLRKDLFYRLSVITIRVPELRERREDIPFLVEHFLDKFSRTYGLRIESVEQRVMDILDHYSWPGNVRQLENLVEQWFAMGRNSMVTVPDLPAEMIGEVESRMDLPIGDMTRCFRSLREIERKVVLETLAVVGHNKSKAASLLGISRKKLYRLLGDDESSEE